MSTKVSPYEAVPSTADYDMVLSIAKPEERSLFEALEEDLFDVSGRIIGSLAIEPSVVFEAIKQGDSRRIQTEARWEGGDTSQYKSVA